MSDKKLSISVELEEGKVQTAIRGLKGIVDALKEIKTQASGISINLVSPTATRGGQPGPYSNSKGSGQQQPGSVSNIAQAVTANAQGLKRVADEAKNSLRALSTSVRDNLRNQRTEVDALIISLNKLQAAYGGIGGGGGRAGGGGGFGTGIGNYSAGVYGGGIGARGDARMSQMITQHDPFQGGRGAGGGGSGGGGGGNDFVTRMASRYLTPIGAIYGAKQAWDFVGGNVKAERGAEYEGRIYSAMESGRRLSESMGTLGRTGISMRGGGNLSSQYALTDLMKSGKFGQVAGLSGDLENKSMLGFGSLTSGDAIKHLTEEQRSLQMRQALNNVPVEQRKLLNESIENQASTMMLRSQRLQEFSSGLGGSISRQVMSGMSRKQTYGVLSTGERMFSEDPTLRLGYNTPFDENQVASEMMGISSSVGRRKRGIAGSMLSKKFGGLYNASDLYGSTSMYQGGGQSFINALSSSSGGRKYNDVTASARVGEAVAKSAAGEFYGTSGTLTAQGLLSLPTGDSGGDMRMASIASKGIQGYGNILGGKVDPLQNALNTLAASNVPGITPYGMKALNNLGPVGITQILRGGELPTALQSAGITRDMVAKYSTGVQEGLFSRYAADLGGNTEQANAVRSIKGGGLSSYITKAMATGGSSGVIDALKVAGGALANSGGAADADTGAGIVFNSLAGTNPELFNQLKGGKVGVSISQLEQSKKNAESTEKIESSKSVGEMRDLINQIKGSTGLGQTLANFAGDLTRGGDRLVANLNAIADGLVEVGKKFGITMPKDAPKKVLSTAEEFASGAQKRMDSAAEKRHEEVAKRGHRVR